MGEGSFTSFFSVEIVSFHCKVSGAVTQISYFPFFFTIAGTAERSKGPTLYLIFPVIAILSPFYYKTGTMGRIGSTSYLLPIRLSYRILNRVIRVHMDFKLGLFHTPYKDTIQGLGSG